MNASEFDAEERFAGELLDADDFALLNSLRAFYDENDPMPDGLVERIQFELTLDALHAEVATLIQVDLEASGARSGGTESVRTVTFTSESLTTMVTLTPQPDGSVRVDGWADPAAQIRVEVILPEGQWETVTDDEGRFVFERVPPGLAKFALYPRVGENESAVLSPTIEL